MDRPRSTPPPIDPSRAQDTLSTPERVRQIEINRLRAKAKHRQREEAEASSSSSVNTHGKRPLSNNAVTRSPTAPGKQKPLARDSRLGKYFDYDLSKMVNTKGGFLVEDDKEVDEAMIAKEKQRERQRAKHNLEPRTSLCRCLVSGMRSSVERNIAGPEDEPEVQRVPVY
jgi:DNA-repair protein complementing XP-A cells